MCIYPDTYYVGPINFPRLIRLTYLVIFFLSVFLVKVTSIANSVFSLILLALCLVDLLTSSSLSFRLYDFCFVFLSFYIIFERVTH